jgi:L-asparaginase
MKIGIVYTGGTIGCVGSPLRPMGEALFEVAFRAHIEPMLQAAQPGVSLHFVPFGPVLDSTDATPHDWVRLARAILGSYSHVDAFVVLHGTDTLAWSASALSFLLTSFNLEGVAETVLSKPIIVTGSQRPLFQQTGPNSVVVAGHTDALANVCGAVESIDLGLPEVAVYFDHQLLRGNRAVKVQTAGFDAFASPNHPPLARCGASWTMNSAVWYPSITLERSLENPDVCSLLQAQLDHAAQRVAQARVALLPAFPAMGGPEGGLHAAMLGAVLGAGVSGVVLQAFGSGNFPSGQPQSPLGSPLFRQLLQARERGVVIVDTTQVLTGAVDSRAYATGSWLGDAGVIGLRDMTPMAALAKLTVLLALSDRGQQPWSTLAIEQLMQDSVAGEIS